MSNASPYGENFSPKQRDASVTLDPAGALQLIDDLELLAAPKRNASALLVSLEETQKKNAPLQAQDTKSLRIAHYALRIEKISFLSLAGQTVIVNRAVLPTSDLCFSAPSQARLIGY